MAAGDGHVPDWKDAAAYQPLLDADRSFFAWEWLRRDPTYRAAAGRAFRADGNAYRCERGEVPEHWGLHAFEHPRLTVPEARPVWCSKVYPFVLGVKAGAPRGEELFDLTRFRPISTLVGSVDGREHLLLSDGCRTIRIDVLAGTITDGPAELRYRLAGLASAERSVLALRRLLALWRTGCFSCSLHPHELRARRWLLMLRAHDALATGANQRAIAAELLGSGATRERWRVEASSLRSQVQRLVQGARHLARGGFWDLLR